MPAVRAFWIRQAAGAKADAIETLKAEAAAARRQAQQGGGR